MYSNETVENLIRRTMVRMDQEVDQSSNFWSNAEMLEYLNEGIHELWQNIRETHQNWFVREMTSRDTVVRIGGRDYDTANLRVQDDRERLLLPPDFQELLFIEGLADDTTTLQVSDPFFPRIQFEYKNLTQRRFRNDAVNFITTNVRRYLYDVVYGATGPYIIFSPPISLAEPLDIKIMYLAMPPKLAIKDTFEATGFTTLMTDALLAYMCYAAATKENLTENLANFGRTWNSKRELAVRAAGPKQTRDEETVEGYLEDEES